MNLSHSVVYAFGALLLASAVASAQGQMEAIAKTSPEQRAKVQTGVMREKLALTAEQLPKIEAINLDIAQQMQPVIESSDAPMTRLRKAHEIEQQRDASLQGVLTPQQYQQWFAMKEDIKQKVEQKLLEKRKDGAQ